jgi:3'(2'), 5'-bisphosphate nucleotidase
VERLRGEGNGEVECDAVKYERELTAAREAADLGARIVERIYRQDFSVDFKGEDDPVTAADREANAAIVALLRERFPSDAICAEETPEEENLANLARGGRCWFVDPVDGTKEFVAKNGEFCVMVGLAIDGVPTVGALVAPAWDRAIWGALGHGAFESRARGPATSLVVAEPDGAPRMVASRSRPDPRVSHVASVLGAGAPRPCGSVGLKVALVAAREADLYVLASGGAKLWDAGAPHAIALSAGATVSDAAGAPIAYQGVGLKLERGIVVGAPSVHARAIEALRSTV